jgi:hypothetical protein
MTRLVYGNFIRVWREKETTLQESRLKRLLLLNLSHEGIDVLPIIKFRMLTVYSKNTVERRRKLPRDGA